MKKADSLTSNIARRAKQPVAGSSPAPAIKTGTGNDHVDVINQLFAELELAYHNQYHKAYGQEGSLNVAKKYWLECLSMFAPETILSAVRNVVKTNEYLPSIATIVQACEDTLVQQGLPSAHAAYVEACCAPNPKAEQRWTHPAVYLAGKQTGWFDLANRTEGQVYTLFEKNYRALVQRAMQGEVLAVDVPKPLPEPGSTVLSPEQNKARMAKLRKQLKKD